MITGIISPNVTMTWPDWSRDQRRRRCERCERMVMAAAQMSFGCRDGYQRLPKNPSQFTENRRGSDEGFVYHRALRRMDRRLFLLRRQLREQLGPVLGDQPADLRRHLVDRFGVFDLPAQRLELLFGKHVTVDLDALAHGADPSAIFLEAGARAALRGRNVTSGARDAGGGDCRLPVDDDAL